MDAGLTTIAFRGLAMLAVKEAGKEAGKRTALVLLGELFGSSDQSFAELSQKLESLERGQEQLRTQLNSLQADVGFRVPLERIYTKVHGLQLAMSRKPSLANIDELMSFLDPAKENSARALADDLAQKLFGMGQTTPDGFWDARRKVGKAGTLGAGHVINVSRDQFKRNVAPLKSYVDTMVSLHSELLSYFALLAGAIIAAHQFLMEKGNPELHKAGKPEYALDEEDNPALCTRPGLAGMASDWLMDYIVQACPPAFDLYRSLFIDRKERRVGLTTKARNRMVEWDTESGRSPIKVSGGMVPSREYNIFKPVYADHEDRGRGNSHQWWRIRPAEAAPSAGDAILVKIDEGERYLGQYSYLSYSHMTKSGKMQSHSDEIGLGSADNPLSRWRLHLRRENGQGETAFVLEHVATERCLLVNGEASDHNRQIHLDEKVKDRGDWIDCAFKVVDPA